MPGGVLCCPAGTGKHRPTTVSCAEYVLKFVSNSHRQTQEPGDCRSVAAGFALTGPRTPEDGITDRYHSLGSCGDASLGSSPCSGQAITCQLPADGDGFWLAPADAAAADDRSLSRSWGRGRRVPGDHLHQATAAVTSSAVSRAALRSSRAIPRRRRYCRTAGALRFAPSVSFHLSRAV